MIPKPTDGTISLIARSPDLDEAAIETVVTVPTFRRPEQILATLTSLARQATPRRFAVITIENDAEQAEGAAAAAARYASGAIEGLLIVAHNRGNCSAYNAGWETALLRFPNLRHLMVIDDDEVADPDWIETMCRFAERGHDIVGGPQVPTFDGGGNAKWARHPVFAAPYSTSGPVKALFSSGNLLVTKPVLAAMGPPFLDLRFNFLGGGDSDFLSRAAARGFRLGWCAEARVSEAIPARRTEWSWIRARSIRNGVISALVDRRRRPGSTGRATVILRSIAFAALAPWRGLRAAMRSGLPIAFLDPTLFAAGRLLAEFGYAREQYREPEKN
ncbi:MAG: glycosyltransferase family 2 protein [Rhizobiaceae bacterium]